jgi:hypothetical protein
MISEHSLRQEARIEQRCGRDRRFQIKKGITAATLALTSPEAVGKNRFLVPLCDLSFSRGAEEEKGDEEAGSRVTREGPARALGVVVKEGRVCVG